MLEEPRLRIEAIGGTSAGAMNAVALTSGWVAGGRRGAQKALADFWGALGTSGNSLPASPCQFNPFDINPLRKIISDQIDFEALRSQSAIRLFIAGKTGEKAQAPQFPPDRS